MEVGGGTVVAVMGGVVDHMILLDVLEPKPVSTRKLRRRANDPVPLPEKRRKAVTYILYLVIEGGLM